jgi:branched-chain amino acid transport system ATP-binding protein
MAILLVEHDMELVMRVCHRLHVLDAGQIVASGSPEGVRADPAVSEAYMGTQFPELVP